MTHSSSSWRRATATIYRRLAAYYERLAEQLDATELEPSPCLAMPDEYPRHYTPHPVGPHTRAALADAARREREDDQIRLHLALRSALHHTPAPVPDD